MSTASEQKAKAAMKESTEDLISSWEQSGIAEDACSSSDAVRGPRWERRRKGKETHVESRSLDENPP